MIVLLAMACSVMAGNGNGKAKDLPNGKPFQNLQQQIDVLTMDMADVETTMKERVDDLQEQLDTLASQVEANQGNITTIQAQQELQDQLIAMLAGNVAELTERVAQNQDDVEDALALLESTLQTAMTAIDTRLFALEEDIEDLGDGVDLNAVGVAANAAAIVQADLLLQEKVGMLQSTIDAAAGVTEANSVSISDLENALDAAQDELATKQHRVSGVCSPGYSIRDIAENGSVSCEADDATARLTTMTSSRSATRYRYSNSNYYYYHASVYCSSGYAMTGGGYYKSANGIKVRYSYPSGNSAWYFSTEYAPYTSSSVYVYVRCIKIY